MSVTSATAGKLNTLERLKKIVMEEGHKQENAIRQLRIEAGYNKHLKKDLSEILNDVRHIEHVDKGVVGIIQTKQTMINSLLTRINVENDVVVANLATGKVLEEFTKKIRTLAGLMTAEAVALEKEEKVDRRWIKLTAKDRKELEKEMIAFKGTTQVIKPQLFAHLKNFITSELTRTINKTEDELKARISKLNSDNEKLRRKTAAININRLFPQQRENLVKARNLIAGQAEKTRQEMAVLENRKRALQAIESSPINEKMGEYFNAVAKKLVREDEEFAREAQAFRVSEGFIEAIRRLNNNELAQMNLVKRELQKAAGGSVTAENKRAIENHLRIILEEVKKERAEAKKLTWEVFQIDGIDSDLLRITWGIQPLLIKIIEIVTDEKDTLLKRELGQITGTGEALKEGISVEEEASLREMLASLNLPPE